MFIAMNRFQVHSEFADTFESEWRKQGNFLSAYEGFMRFYLLRSDNQDGITEFVSHSQWLKRKHFTAWLKSEDSQDAYTVMTKNQPALTKMLREPPQFRGYDQVMDEVVGNRVDARSAFQDIQIESHFAIETEAQKTLRRTSLSAGLPPIAISPFEGKMLELLLKAARCQKGVEIGTLGGYSTTWLCRGLKENGFVWSCELDPGRADIARQQLAQAGLAERTQVLSGPALETLKTIENQGPFDFVFIDANKADYPNYCRWAFKHLKEGGLILCDNAYLWGAMHHWNSPIVDLPKSPRKDLHAYTKSQFIGMSHCWEELCNNVHLTSLIVPTGDGLAVAVKNTAQ